MDTHTLPPQCACHLNTERDEQATFIIPICQPVSELPIGWMLIRLICQPVSETTIDWLYGGNWMKLLVSQSNVHVHYKGSCIHQDIIFFNINILDYMNEWMNDAFIYHFIVYSLTPKALYNHEGGSLLNHYQCAASTWMMRRQPHDNGASALTTHQLQEERRERHRANQVYGDY